MQFWLLAGFLVLVFLAGGGARADIRSLLFLRPIAVCLCGFAACTIRPDHIRERAGLLGILGALSLICLIQLLPLPPSLWSALPGRTLVSQVDGAASLGAVWRPISLTPDGTWNSFYSLFVPLAVILLGAQVAPRDLMRLVPIMIGLGILSGVIGLLQVVGSPTGPMYFYHVTNNGSAVGLFANRNHAALFLCAMFPMLAVFASYRIKTVEQARIRLWMSAVIAVVLLPLILVTGSRAGLLIGMVGIVAAFFIYRIPQIMAPAKRRNRRLMMLYSGAGFGLVAIGVMVALFSRARAVDRLLGASEEGELRLQVLPIVGRMIREYFPFGAGFGSFVPAYQIEEPNVLLSPNYVNHAHNDWFEFVLTGGLPAVLLLAVILFWLVRLAVRSWRPAVGQSMLPARMASIVLVMFALSSAVDYPLRVPSLMCLAALAGLWLTSSSIGDDAADGGKQMAISR